MRRPSLLIGLGGILTVVRLPFLGVLAPVLAVLGAVAMVLGALLLQSRVSAATRSVGAGLVLVAVAAGLEIGTVLPLAGGGILGTTGPVLRAAGVLALAWGAAHDLDRRGAPLDRVYTWLATFVVGLVTWLPLTGVIGSAAWHIATGRSDASFSISGAGSLLVMAAAVAPLVVLVALATLWVTDWGPDLEQARGVRR